MLRMIGRLLFFATIVVGGLIAWQLVVDQADSDGTDPEVDSVSLTIGEAVEVVQAHVAQEGGTVVVSVPYWVTVEERIACSQIDVDTDPHKGDPFLAKCQPIDGASGAPYSYRTVTRQERRCCEERFFAVPSGSEWTADYGSSTDEWNVSVEFEIEGVDQSESWIVDDDTREVRG